MKITAIKFGIEELNVDAIDSNPDNGEVELTVDDAQNLAELDNHLNYVTEGTNAAEIVASGLESLIVNLAAAIENDTVTPEMIDLVEQQTVNAVVELGGDETSVAIESGFVGSTKERAQIALENAVSTFEHVIQAITENTHRTLQGMQAHWMGYGRVYQSLRAKAKGLVSQTEAVARSASNGTTIIISDAGFGDRLMWDFARSSNYTEAFRKDIAFADYLYGRFAKDVMGEFKTFTAAFGAKADFGNPDFINNLAKEVGKLTKFDDIVPDKFKNNSENAFNMGGFWQSRKEFRAKKDLSMGQTVLPVGELRTTPLFDYAWASASRLHGNTVAIALVNFVTEVLEAQEVTLKVSELPGIAKMNDESLNVNTLAFDEIFRTTDKYRQLVKNTFWKALAKPGAYGRIETIRLIWAMDKIARNYYYSAYTVLLEDFSRRVAVSSSMNRALRIAIRKAEKAAR